MQITKDSKISYNPRFLTLDGQPWFPMMGEIHYSRVREEDWKEELCKMKAGGIDLVSAYTIWIHHEEIQNEFDFTGQRNLHKFMETVKKCGLHCVLRIGPWAHGEARNGGFPDWLVDLEKEGRAVLRSDDPAYLHYVRIFYEKIFDQVKGLFLADQGPILGIQIENEYGHVGGQTGEVGEAHMRTLQQMAKEIGFEVPIYTATGWGGAVTGGMIPVMGGYCEAPWDQRLTEIEPSGNYVFTKERNDHGIGSDHGLGEGVTFSYSDFPYLTAELGGGLQVTRHRRCIAAGRDTQAMTLAKLGSGVNLLGYYMYHGGTNPEGRLTTLQESRATGYPNDLPVKSYDFNAPLREYGQISDAYRRIRMYAMMIHDFGQDLCLCDYIGQPGNPESPEDLTSLRTAVRYDEESGQGFYFLNNYQRRYEMAEHPGASLKALGSDGSVLHDFGREDIHNGDYFFYPFGLKIGQARVSVKASPLCILHGGTPEGGNVYVFYYREGVEQPQAEVVGDLQGNRLLFLTENQALHSFKYQTGEGEILLVNEQEGQDFVPDSAGTLRLVVRVAERVRPSFIAYPEALVRDLPGYLRTDAGEGFARFVSQETLWNPALVKTEMEEQRKDSDTLKAHVLIGGIDQDADQILLTVDYDGETARMYRDGQLVADNFYTGQIWETDVRRFAVDGQAELTLDFQALRADTPVYLQTWPAMEDDRALRVRSILTEAVYHLDLKN